MSSVKRGSMHAKCEPIDVTRSGNKYLNLREEWHRTPKREATSLALTVATHTQGSEAVRVDIHFFLSFLLAVEAAADFLPPSLIKTFFSSLLTAAGLGACFFMAGLTATGAFLGALLG